MRKGNPPSLSESATSTKKARARVIRRQLSEMTNGLVGSVTNLVLLQLFFGLGVAAGCPRSRDVYRALQESNNLLEQVNYNTLRQTLTRLQKQGLIEHIRQEGGLIPRITRLGRERLDCQIPTYQPDRPWDKRLYLVVYDVPEENHRQRDALREILKQLKCAQFQASVWITPYNPRSLLSDYIKENNLPGEVIVADTGLKGSVGQESAKALLARIYRLNELNEQYQDFLAEYQNGLTERGKEGLMVDYLTILRADPQLPSELLPDYWEGDRAYLKFAELLETA